MQTSSPMSSAIEASYVGLAEPTSFGTLAKIHKKAVLDCCFSPDTDQILTAGEDNSIVLWNLPDHDVELHNETKNDEHKIKCERYICHKAPVMSVAINEFFCVSASKDGRAKLWKFSRGESYGNVIKKIRVEPITYKCHSGIVRSVAISPFCRSFATCSDDKSIKIWSTDCTNKMILSLPDGHTNWVKCVRWSKLSGSILASCGDDNKICLWDTRVKIRQPPYCIIPARRSMLFNSLDWHPVFDFHIATGGQDSSVIVWDLRNKKQIQTYKEHTAAVNSVAFSNTGSLLLSGSSDRSTKMFDVCEGINTFTIKSHKGAVTSVCFNSDDELFATSSTDQETTVWKKNFEALIIEACDEEENETI